jgi:hypothetical protein
MDPVESSLLAEDQPFLPERDLVERRLPAIAALGRSVGLNASGAYHAPRAATPAGESPNANGEGFGVVNQSTAPPATNAVPTTNATVDTVAALLAADHVSAAC